jgi:hypothetical protein
LPAAADRGEARLAEMNTSLATAAEASALASFAAATSKQAVQ